MCIVCDKVVGKSNANKEKIMSTISLQSIGTVSAKPAQDFKVGEVILWNFGSKAKILAVVSQTAKFITFQIEESTGVYSRRLKKDRLVGVA